MEQWRKLVKVQTMAIERLGNQDQSANRIMESGQSQTAESTLGMVFDQVQNTINRLTCQPMDEEDHVFSTHIAEVVAGKAMTKRLEAEKVKLEKSKKAHSSTQQ